jgi:hypothetical protein
MFFDYLIVICVMKSVFRKGAGFFILSRKYGIYKKISSLPGRYRKEDTNTKTKLDLTKLFYCGVSQLLSVRCKDIENIFNTQTIINKI